MEPSDTALVEASRQGDNRAWQTLVERYQRLVFTVPRRAGLDEERAGEITQHVFSKLVKNIDRIQQPERVKAWLVTTARRETFHMVEKERRTVESDRDVSEQEYLPDLNSVPDEVVMRLEEQNSVRLAVAQVGDRCRELLTLLFYHHEPVSYSDIARQLGIAEGSIGPTRARCLEKVQKVLARDGFFICILLGLVRSVG